MAALGRLNWWTQEHIIDRAQTQHQPAKHSIVDATMLLKHTVEEVFRLTDVTAESINNAFQAVKEAIQPLRESTTGGGAYVNEADTFEPDPVGTSWAIEDYKMLLIIKREVDPGKIMQVYQGVG